MHGTWLLVAQRTGRIAMISTPPQMDGSCHTLDWWFEHYDLGGMRDYLTFNWQDILNNMLDAIRSNMPSLNDIFPNLDGQKAPKVKGFKKAYGTKRFPESHYLGAAAVSAGDASHRSHKAVHELRVEYERARHCMLQIVDSLADLGEMANSPHELQKEAMQLKVLIKSSHTILKRCSTGNAVCKLMAQAGLATLQAAERSTDRTINGLKNVHRKMNLEARTRQIATARRKFNKKALFEKMEKGNKRLMDVSGRAATCRAAVHPYPGRTAPPHARTHTAVGEAHRKGRQGVAPHQVRGPWGRGC